jgi:hypothetical protein
VTSLAASLCTPDGGVLLLMILYGTVKNLHMSEIYISTIAMGTYYVATLVEKILYGRPRDKCIL